MYTEHDAIETPNSPLKLQALALKKAIDISSINFKFLVETSNILYGETLLTEQIRGILNIDSALDEKKGDFVVNSSPLEFVTTVTWEYMPDYRSDVLRLWLTSVEKISSQEVKQRLSVLDLLAINRQEKEFNQQFYQHNNEHIDHKNSKLKQVFQLLTSDEFVNACLTYATVIFIFLAVGFPLLDFRDKLQQEQRQPTLLFNENSGVLL